LFIVFWNVVNKRVSLGAATTTVNLATATGISKKGTLLYAGLQRIVIMVIGTSADTFLVVAKPLFPLPQP
jgi:hypothetical protein